MWHIVVEPDNVARHVIVYADGNAETYLAPDVALLSDQTMQDLGVATVEEMLAEMNVTNGLTDEQIAETRE